MPERAVGLGFVVEDRLGGAGEVVVSGGQEKLWACQMSIHAQVSREGRRCGPWRHWAEGPPLARSEVFATLRSRGTRASADAVVC